ncbi:hypothetical protein Hanom_Chr16g01510561 [Helianthus anomalus]
MYLIKRISEFVYWSIDRNHTMGMSLVVLWNEISKGFVSSSKIHTPEPNTLYDYYPHSLFSEPPIQTHLVSF